MKTKVQAKSQAHPAPQDSGGRSPAQRKAGQGVESSPLVLQQKAFLDSLGGATAQRFTEEEEKPLQGRFDGPIAQRAGDPEEELPLQGRFDGPVAQREDSDSDDEEE